MLNIIYRIYIKSIDLNIVTRNQVNDQKKKYYNYDKKEYFVKDCQQLKKLFWKSISQKNVNIVNTKRNIAMVEQISFPINFGNTFVSISLDILNIEIEEDLDIDRLENFNVDIQIYLTFEEKYKEFTVIKVNLNIARKDDEKHPYNENDLYFEFNNVGYNDIIQMNYIYNYYVFYLESKIIYNFFSKVIFKLIKKTYKEEETRYQIFTIKTTIYKIFVSSFEHPPIYIKKEVTLERY